MKFRLGSFNWQKQEIAAQSFRLSKSSYFVLLRTESGRFWRDNAEMYCRNADFGKIRFKCTENELKTLSEGTFQRYLARKSGFICPSVHNSEISPSHSRSVRRAQRRSLRPFRMRHPAFRPVAAIFLVRKQKSWLLCNFFSIRDSFLSSKSGNGSFL